jgi:hypothetical protein
VRQQYARLRPLEKLGHDARGWRLDVLNVVRAIGREEFSLADVYARRAELARLHPHNLHVHDKIRQQLQRLRDLGIPGICRARELSVGVASAFRPTLGRLKAAATV